MLINRTHLEIIINIFHMCVCVCVCEEERLSMENLQLGCVHVNLQLRCVRVTIVDVEKQ